MNGRISQAWPLGGVRCEEVSRGEGRVGVWGGGTVWRGKLELQLMVSRNLCAPGSRQTPKPPVSIGNRTQVLCRSSQVPGYLC